MPPTCRTGAYSAALCLTLVSLSGCADLGTETGAAQAAVVYGNDDRQDVYAHGSAAFRTLAQQSIAALIPSWRVNTSNPSNVTISAGTLGAGRNLCAGERFFDDPTAASCSGTLVDSRVLITAGHCVENQSDCEGFRYVFDYYHQADGVLANIDIDDVYSCDRVVATLNDGATDYAVIELDRDVVAPHVPATLQVTEPMTLGQGVAVIGFGSGIPAKIDTGGSVTTTRSGTLDFFTASTDTFGGNSGSGVFRTDNGAMVGILVRGDTDYVSSGSCNIVNVNPEPSAGQSAEAITYVGRAIDAACAAGLESTLCGTTDAYCQQCTPGSCPGGWSCDGTGVCVFDGCSGDGDCRDDHECVSTQCVPRQSTTCHQGDVWVRDSCGQLLAIDTNCGSGTCTDAACVTPPEGDSCADAIAISPTTQTITGTFEADLSHTETGSCAGAGPDRVYAFTLSAATEFMATASGFDTTLYLRGECDNPGSELACNDDIDYPSNTGSMISYSLTAGTYYLVLDAYADVTGSYQLDLVFTPVVALDQGVAPVDMGSTTPDMGSATADMGVTTTDQGAAAQDSGAAPDGGSTQDAGAAEADAGQSRPVRGSSCAAGGAPTGGHPLLPLAGLVFLISLRRRMR